MSLAAGSPFGKKVVTYKVRVVVRDPAAFPEYKARDTAVWRRLSRLRRARRLAASVAQGLLRAAAAGEEAAEPHRGRRVRARMNAPAGRVPGQARAPPRVPQRRGAARLPHRAGPRARPRVARICALAHAPAAKRRGPLPTPETPTPEAPRTRTRASMRATAEGGLRAARLRSRASFLRTRTRSRRQSSDPSASSASSSTGWAPLGRLVCKTR